ncbi:MAG: endonuclease III [Acidobacteria bacterium]|nr:MAG: endonuclease III [Acidobacteriota bacterium]
MMAVRQGAASAKAREAERLREILRRLADSYPDAVCALHFTNPFQLLVATILSAQCTDARVNMVTPALFERYPDARAMAQADPEQLQEMIRSTGFFRNKTKSLIGASQTLVREFGGEVPQSMEEMLRLPGVARKTANVVLGTAYGITSGVVVDTHVARVSARLRFTRHAEPEKIENDLMRKVPREEWIAFAHRLIHHGRRVCRAPKPKCQDCMLTDLCYYYRTEVAG